MKDNLVEQQIVKMNKKSEQSSGMFQWNIPRYVQHHSDNQDRSPMIAQLASLQRLKEVIPFARINRDIHCFV